MPRNRKLLAKDKRGVYKLSSHEYDCMGYYTGQTECSLKVRCNEHTHMLPVIIMKNHNNPAQLKYTADVWCPRRYLQYSSYST
jgi:hypothetical protein